MSFEFFKKGANKEELKKISEQAIKSSELSDDTFKNDYTVQQFIKEQGKNNIEGMLGDTIADLMTRIYETEEQVKFYEKNKIQDQRDMTYEILNKEIAELEKKFEAVKLAGEKATDGTAHQEAYLEIFEKLGSKKADLEMNDMESAKHYERTDAHKKRLEKLKHDLKLTESALKAILEEKKEDIIRKN